MLVLIFGNFRLFQLSIYTKIRVGESPHATVHVVIVCSLTGRCQHFGEPYYLRLSHGEIVAEGSSKALVPIYPTRTRHIPENHTLQFYSRKDVESHVDTHRLLLT
jgi:hypothetical protein